MLIYLLVISYCLWNPFSTSTAWRCISDITSLTRRVDLMLIFYSYRAWVAIDSSRSPTSIAPCITKSLLTLAKHAKTRHEVGAQNYSLYVSGRSFSYNTTSPGCANSSNTSLASYKLCTTRTSELLDSID